MKKLRVSIHKKSWVASLLVLTLSVLTTGLTQRAYAATRNSCAELFLVPGEQAVKSPARLLSVASFAHYVNKVPVMVKQKQALREERESILSRKSEIKAERNWRSWNGIRHVLYANHQSTFELQALNRDLRSISHQLRKIDGELEKEQVKTTYSKNYANYNAMERTAERVGYDLLRTNMYSEFFSRIESYSLVNLTAGPETHESLALQFVGSIAVSIGGVYYTYAFRFDYDFIKDRVLQAGLIQSRNRLETMNRPYDLIRQNGIYAYDLERSLQPQTVSQYLRNLRLKFAIDDIEKIQRRMNNDQGYREQIETVVVFAFQTGHQPARELMESYFYFWLMMAENPIAPEAVPPTAWFQQNLMFAQHTQMSIAHVINATLDDLLVGEPIQIKELQNHFDQTGLAELLNHPIRLDGVYPIRAPSTSRLDQFNTDSGMN